MLEIIEAHPLLSFLYLLFAVLVLVYTIWSLTVTHGAKVASRKAMHAILSGDAYQFTYITPSEAIALGDGRSLDELAELSVSEGTCEACGAPAWRYAGNGLCFPCTTGSADASGDYELVPDGVKP